MKNSPLNISELFLILKVYLDISPKANNLLKIWKHEDELLGRWVSKNKFFEDHLKEYSNEVDNFSNLFSVLDASDYM